MACEILRSGSQALRKRTLDLFQHLIITNFIFSFVQGGMYVIHDYSNFCLTGPQAPQGWKLLVRYIVS